MAVFLPGEFHGQRSLASYSPWDRKELDTTELLTTPPPPPPPPTVHYIHHRGASLQMFDKRQKKFIA